MLNKKDNSLQFVCFAYREKLLKQSDQVPVSSLFSEGSQCVSIAQPPYYVMFRVNYNRIRMLKIIILKTA